MRTLLRPIGFAITVVLLVFAVWETWWLIGWVNEQHALGVDLDYYKFIAQRWLDTGVWYTDRQLAGAYEQQTLVDNLYPPHALYLFLPWLWIPFPLWYLAPLGMLAYTIWRMRPKGWFWPVFALIAAWPKTPNAILYGNSDLWVLFFACAGVLWGWPGAIATFKPSMAPFALAGAHRKRYWVALGVIALASLPQVQLWLLWPRVIDNSSSTVEYSLAAMPMMTLPFIARLAATTRPPIHLPDIVTRLRPRSTLARS